MAMKDISPLLQMSDTLMVAKFLHGCVDDMIGKRKMSYSNYNHCRDMEWTKEEYDATKKCIQHFYMKNIGQNFDSGLELPAELQEIIQNCFNIRKNDIFQALAKDALLKNGNILVENLDWKLKWILGSSDLATLKEPLLQIKLDCVRNTRDRIKKHIVPLEADLNQVENLIKKLSALKIDLKQNLATQVETKIESKIPET